MNPNLKNVSVAEVKLLYSYCSLEGTGFKKTGYNSLPLASELYQSMNKVIQIFDWMTHYITEVCTKQNI